MYCHGNTKMKLTVQYFLLAMSLSVMAVDIEDDDVISFTNVWAGQHATFAKAHGSFDIYACGHNHRSQLGRCLSRICCLSLTTIVLN